MSKDALQPMPDTEAPSPGKDKGDQFYMASQWRLMWWKFLDHRLAVCAMGILIAFYIVAAFCEFMAPNAPNQRDAKRSFECPQGIHIIHEGKLKKPFVYPRTQHIDQETLVRTYTNDTSHTIPVRLFAKGDPYRLWGIIPMERHLLGLADGNRIYPMGADRLGRCLFSRIIYGSRISLSLGLVAVCMTLVLGVVIGGISGYYGGHIDNSIQRFIEILRSIPQIPLWLALSAAMPAHWSQIRIYFFMTIILASIGWTGLARVVRGKILSLREEDYAVAARVAGVREFTIIMKHLIPGFLSHLIVSVTLAIPGMILAETSLSFLRLGLRPPTISWGVLLQDAQNMRAVELYPWLLLPVLFVITAVLMFNFLGDGLRDAADPYSH